MGWTNPVILGSLGIAAVLGVAFAWWELRNPQPMLQLSFFRKPGFSIASFAGRSSLICAVTRRPG
jgi:hypothetical protein